MKVSLCLFTPLACLFLHSCAPTITVASLEKSLAQEVSPITKSPKETLIGAWIIPTGQIMIYHKNGSYSYVGKAPNTPHWSPEGNISAWSPSENNKIPKGKMLFHRLDTQQFKLADGSKTWAYNGDAKRGVLSHLTKSASPSPVFASIGIIFVNDNKIIREIKGKPTNGNSRVGVYTRTQVRKAPKVPKPKKSSSTSSGVSKNVQRYYDWLVRREFGDPGPIPKVSNFDRQKAVIKFTLRTGTRPSPEINYGR